LRRVAYLLCQDWQRADDLVQAAITRLYVRWDRVRGMEHLEAYARTVREYLSEQRSGWARRVSLDVPVPDTAGRAPDTETKLDMRAALAGLPPRQRATLVLRQGHRCTPRPPRPRLRRHGVRPAPVPAGIRRRPSAVRRK
jgi:RNA polymerase sigma factor (sigma-70 family)